LTLIELLVVILIISILTGLAFYKFSPENFQKKNINSESLTLVRLCNNLRSIALLKNNAYGLSIATDGYFWWELDHEKALWKVLKKSPYSYHQIGEENYRIELMNNTDNNNNFDYPHIIFYPDSTITPFKCLITKEPDLSITILTNGVSDVQIQQ
jgi:type II secretory pathway pseudopilin PulG